MDLHSEFVRLGKERNKITYQLLALLPEIHKSEIYRIKGYGSIYEYAGKLAGLSRELIDKSLNVSRYLKEKPNLQTAVSEVGIHKVALVAKLATSETDKAWADKVRHMSRASLIELAKETRQNVPGKTNMPKETTDDDCIPCKAVKKKLTIELDEEMKFLFLKIKKKLGRNLSHKEILMEVLISYVETDVGRIKQPITQDDKFCTGTKFVRNQNSGKENLNNGHGSRVKRAWAENCKRYIPVSQKREALIKNKGRCGYPLCGKPPDIMHHRKRFSESKNHESIVPLCREHHEFMHNGLIENEIREPNEWRLKLRETPEKMADFLFRRYRKRAVEGG